MHPDIDDEKPFPNIGETARAMPSPIMCGETKNRQPFLIFKVGCEVTDENIQFLTTERMRTFNGPRQQGALILLVGVSKKNGYIQILPSTDKITEAVYSENTKAFREHKFSYHKNLVPNFFLQENITDTETGVVNEGQKDGFQRFHDLIKNGSAVDQEGFKWQLV